MDSSISDNLRAHTFGEMCKTEAINACMEMLKTFDGRLNKPLEEVVLRNVTNLMDQYKLNEIYNLDSYSFKVPGEQSEEVKDFFIKASDVSEVFVELQSKVVGLLIELVATRLAAFMLAEEKNNDEGN